MDIETKEMNEFVFNSQNKKYVLTKSEITLCKVFQNVIQLNETESEINYKHIFDCHMDMIVLFLKTWNGKTPLPIPKKPYFRRMMPYRYTSYGKIESGHIEENLLNELVKFHETYGMNGLYDLLELSSILQFDCMTESLSAYIANLCVDKSIEQANEIYSRSATPLYV